MWMDLRKFDSDILNVFLTNICQLIMDVEVIICPQKPLSLYIRAIFTLCYPTGADLATLEAHHSSVTPITESILSSFLFSAGIGTLTY